MQAEPFGARQEVIVAPTFGGSIAAAGKKSVEHRQVDRPLDVKFEAPAFEQGAQRLRNSALLPQAAEG
jgi:hypothetical protein